MSDHLRIGVIGPGRIGSSLARIWAKKGHHVFLSFSRSTEKLEALAGEVANSRFGSPAEAVASSDVILLSVPWTAVREALDAAGPLDGKIVIDCTNPLLPDLSGLAIGHTTSAAEEIARLVPKAKVAKAFNTVFADVYDSSMRLFGSRLASMFHCGDDAEARVVVARLIQDVGFEPIDAGPLSSARYLEPLAMLLIRLGYGQHMGTNIALTLLRR